MTVEGEPSLNNIKRGSIEEFIFEHYWGYNKYNDTKTVEYGVEHIVWQTHKIKSWSLNCDIKIAYGVDFFSRF